MAKVYISSTFIDLEQHRAAVITSLRRAGHEITVMEDYPAFDERPAEKCMRDVAGCDIYVGIIGFRYGFIPLKDNPKGKSITELEYLAAKNKKRLIFQLHPDTPWPRRFSDEISGEAECGGLINIFRTHLSNEHGDRFFKSPEDLATQVLAAISSLGQPKYSHNSSDISELIINLNLKIHEQTQELRQKDRQIELLTQQINQSNNINPQRINAIPSDREGLQ